MNLKQWKLRYYQGVGAYMRHFINYGKQIKEFKLNGVPTVSLLTENNNKYLLIPCSVLFSGVPPGPLAAVE